MARRVKEGLACKAAMLMCEALMSVERHWESRIIDSYRPGDGAFELRYRGSFGRTYH